MAAVRRFEVKNSKGNRKITATGNLSALLICAFGSSKANHLEKCNISTSEDGRLQARINGDFYTVKEAI